ncbi:MAG: MOSC domain-containing protein [Pseudomonadota bacterium]
MEKTSARVESVHVGAESEYVKEGRKSIEIALDGIVGDRHRSHTRVCWVADKQPEGIKRRNERQWSAVSLEELSVISDTLGLDRDLMAQDLGANLCLSGVPNLSRLAKGSLLRFPSGAELMVEEYNPPCHDMGKFIAANYKTKQGDDLRSTAFSKAAMFTRGIVGVVEAEGEISVGDDVYITPYKAPSWSTED